MKRMNELTQIGFQIDKTNQVAYGIIGQYHYLLTYYKQNKQLYLKTSIHLSADDHIALMNLPLTVIDQLKYENLTLIMMIKDVRKVSVNEIEKMMQIVSLFLSQRNIKEVCHYCQQEKPVHVCQMQGTIELVCDDCLNQYQNLKPGLVPVQFSRGLIGILGGSIIGMVIWILIYQLGYIAGISGLVMAYLCIRGYEKLAGRLDKKGLFIAIIVAIIMLAFAEIICVNIEVAKSFNMSFGEALEFLPEVLEESEIQAAIFQDLAFGYIFMLAASYSLYVQEYRRIKQQGVYEKKMN